MTPLFYSVVLSHASDNTTSRNIGRTDIWVVPPQILGDLPPSAPLSIRPCRSSRNFSAFILKMFGITGDNHHFLVCSCYKTKFHHLYLHLPTNCTIFASHKLIIL